MDDCLLHDGASCAKPTVRARREYASRGFQPLGANVVVGDHVHQLAIEPIDDAEKTLTQAHGVAHDRLEHRLELGLRVGKWSYAVAGDQNQTDRLSFSQHRDAEGSAIADGRCLGQVVLRIRVDVLYVYDASCQYHAAAHASSISGSRVRSQERIDPLGRDVVVRNHVQELAIEAVDQRIESFAESRGAGRNGIEHRLNVGG